MKVDLRGIHVRSAPPAPNFPGHYLTDAANLRDTLQQNGGGGVMRPAAAVLLPK